MSCANKANPADFHAKGCLERQAEQNHWSERGQAVSVANSGALQARVAQLWRQATSPTMLQIRTKMSYETAQQTLACLLAKEEKATGELNGNTFSLRLIPRSGQTEVKLRGHIVRDNGGTLLCASPCLPWAAIILLPIFTGILIALHASIWFIVLGFLVVAFNFVLATRRGYDFLRKTYAA